MSDADRNNNKDGDRSRSVEENPFVKFRRSVDETVGAVLQGIVGLPSAFSRDPERRNTGWADEEIDDIQRRSAILRERQDALREFWQKSEQSMSQEEAGFDSNDQNSRVVVYKGAASDSPFPVVAGRMDDEGEDRSPDLYSPVTKSLFAHLRQKGSEWPVWPSHFDRLLDMSSPIQYSICQSAYMMGLKDTTSLTEAQRQSKGLERIQYMVLNTLNREANSRDSCLWLHSSNSVLPYLLSSPYSPLALTSMPPPLHRPHSNPTSDYPIKSFPYCEAFEDLLLASQNLDMGPAPGLDTPEFRKQMTIPEKYDETADGMHFINRLESRGLLSGDPLRQSFVSSMQYIFQMLNSLPTGNDVAQMASPLNILRGLDNSLFGLLFSDDDDDGSKHHSADEAPEAARRIAERRATAPPLPPPTELEMYERLLGDAAHSGVRAAHSQILRELALARGTSAPAPHEPVDVGIDGPHRRPSSGDTDFENAPSLSPSWLAERQQQQQQQIAGTQPDCGDERVVSSSTTTEYTTTEDGAVRTKVVVEKRFADGRHTRTEKVHTQAANERSGAEKPGMGNAREREAVGEEAVVRASGGGKTEKEKEKKAAARGWFWN